MTIAAEQCRLWILDAFPGTPISRFACRDTASGRVSQHSAYGSPGSIDSNALDVFGPGKSSQPGDQAWIQAIVDTIENDGRHKWSIRQIVWLDGGAHENHAHIDFYPYIRESMWCGKSWDPTWQHSRSSGKGVITSRNPQPENGLYDGSGSEPIPTPPGDDMQDYVRAQQENLNAAGITDMNGDELAVDGIYGPKTQSAQLKRDVMATEGGGGMVPHTHPFGGETGLAP